MRRKLDVIELVPIVVFILLCFPFFAQATDNTLVRLHVLANSDEQNDQELKLIIRDQILTDLESLKNIATTEVAIKYIEGNLKTLQPKLEDIISEAGFNYSLNIRLEESDFPTRKYQNTVLPAGRYLALKVIIGEGKGANWWCVLFPPICHGDWVQEPRRKMVDEENTLPVITIDNERIEQDNSLKKVWKEYTKLLLKVWSFSKSP